MALLDWEAIISGGVAGGAIAVLTEAVIRPWAESRAAKRGIRGEVLEEARLLLTYAVALCTMEAPADADRHVREGIARLRDDNYRKLVERAAELPVKQTRYLSVYPPMLTEKVLTPYISTVHGVMLSARDRTSKAEIVRDMIAQFDTAIIFAHRSWLRRLVTMPWNGLRLIRAINEIAEIQRRSHERRALPAS
ncbi:hypothetical protein [Virgisporangium aurantiacum]|uniref:Uncharacterized protein n=1 Tax=Virgisporangium aurantiacum TaxID=175570 RepID=A0A8J4E2H8_9ACTN|nr:hypothetical protein [Virgisporangium aurantiacum]GIJ58918.1 hypothetical protein Vau01_064340 [Virgisporangium aurantiacum]